MIQIMDVLALHMKNGMLAQLRAKNLKIFKNLKIMLNGGGIEMSKIIIEDQKYYIFIKANFKDLTDGQMFMDNNGKLFIKTTYCNLIDRYATSLSDGDYKLFASYDEVWPVDCEITFRRILEHADKED